MLDLGQEPQARFPVPAIPPVYARILARDPDAVLFEAPHFNTAFRLPSSITYWQADHGARTSAGYTANFNMIHENLLTYSSPFLVHRLADPTYLDDPESESFDLVQDMPFEPYTWLYLTHHGFDYVVLHHASGSYPEMPTLRLDRLEGLLAHARVDEDDEAVVFARERLRPPTRPVLLCTEGWGMRFPWRGRMLCQASRSAEVVLFNPPGEREIRIAIEATAYEAPRQVRLLEGGRELARWTVPPGPFATFTSPPLRVGEGFHTLTIASDGESTFPRQEGLPVSEYGQPFGLLAASIRLQVTERPTPVIAEGEPGPAAR